MNPAIDTRPRVFLFATLAACMLTSMNPAVAQWQHGDYQRERLGRGLVALHDANGKVCVSWRLLATDDPNVAFDVYKRVNSQQPVKVNSNPITGATFLIDRNVELSQSTKYFVAKEGDPLAAAEDSAYLLRSAESSNYLSIPIKPPDGFHANDCAPGDLDGDGEYELVVHMVGRGRDNSRGGFSTEPIFHAYKLDGTLLWNINLGKNIREGAHYTQFLVYDFDGDGRSELVCKTADGTVDGLGKVIGDAQADHRIQEGTREGIVLSGPEFLTVFDGRTGAAIDTQDYIPARGGDGSQWGDRNGNRVDRFLACAAYLDGQRPSIIMCRGYYTRAVLAAWDFRDGKLKGRWVFDSDEGTPGNRAYRGQGNHNLTVTDVDADGKDEIVYGGCVIDDNGKGLFSTGLGHGDALHVGDLDPTRPGLEVWKIVENEEGHPSRPGRALYDARTGEIIFSDSLGQDIGRGMAADIDPRHPGVELWGGPAGLCNVKGQPIGASPRSVNFGIWWDGDPLRELLNGVDISKWDYENSKEIKLFSGREVGLASNNSSKSNPCLSADLLGDWREELVARTSDNREIRIYSTTIPTNIRLPTLMHDRQYRMSIVWQNTGYNQPPHTSYFLGHGMQVLPPRK